MAINAEHSRAYAALVARRVAKCISAYSAKVDTGFAIRIRADCQNRAFSYAKPDSGLPLENARRKNNDAGTKARVIDSNLKKIAQRDPRGPAPGPPRPPPGPPRSAPGPAPNTGFGFIGSKPSRCSFLRASLRARRTASAFSRAFFSEGFS